MEIEIQKIENLKLYEKNARRHPEKQIELLIQNITEFGFTTPILIDKNDEVIAGHGRIEAMKRMGETQVPCIRMEKLSKKQVQALRLADNRVTEMSEWDMFLALDELKLLDLDLAKLTGFEIGNLESLEIVDNIANEWDGMPDFNQEDKTAYRQIIVSFKTEEDVQEFAGMIEQNITSKTKSVWYPRVENEKVVDKIYE